MVSPFWEANSTKTMWPSVCCLSSLFCCSAVPVWVPVVSLCGCVVSVVYVVVCVVLCIVYVYVGSFQSVS